MGTRLHRQSGHATREGPCSAHPRKQTWWETFLLQGSCWLPSQELADQREQRLLGTDHAVREAVDPQLRTVNEQQFKHVVDRDLLHFPLLLQRRLGDVGRRGRHCDLLLSDLCFAGRRHPLGALERNPSGVELLVVCSDKVLELLLDSLQVCRYLRYISNGRH